MNTPPNYPREGSAEVRASQWLEECGRDLRLAIRLSLRNPGFTIVAALTAGLGIGVSTAVFCFINSVLLRQLPVRDPSQVVVIAARVAASTSYKDFSFADYSDLREQSSPAFSEVMGYIPSFAGFAVDGQSDQILASYVSSNFFSGLGVQPFLGRVLEPGDDDRSAVMKPVATLSYDYWQRRFHGDPAVVGKLALVNGKPVAISGVAAKTFKGVFAFMTTDVFVPINQMRAERGSDWASARGAGDIRLLGRMRAHVHASQARAVLQGVAAKLARLYPATNEGVTYDVIPETLARPQPDAATVWPLVLSIAGALGMLVAVVACVNMAALVLTRVKSRAAEMATRLSLGSSKADLTRQVVIENLVLAIPGGLAGGIIAAGLSAGLASMTHPVDYPSFGLDLVLDWRVFAVETALVLVFGCVTGAVAARAVLRSSLNLLLRDRAGNLGLGRSSAGQRRVLVAIQFAASTVLVFATGVFVHVRADAQRMKLGFDPTPLLNVSMDVAQAGYDEIRGKAVYAELLERVRAMPGVESAAYTTAVPFASGNRHARIYTADRSPSHVAEVPEAFLSVVSPGYFQTMSIPILRGRAFDNTDQEARLPVAVVNQTMAERVWPHQDAVGKSFRQAADSPVWFRVVGVARDAMYLNPFVSSQSFFYVPIAQQYEPARTLQVRSSGPPMALAASLYPLLHTVAPGVPIASMLTMRQQLQGVNGFYLFNVNANMAAVLAVIGLSLAAVGIYGVLSHSTARRTREIGVRMALGATPLNVQRLILTEGARLFGIGAAVGVALSMALGAALVQVLPAVRGLDLLSLLAAVLVVSATALLACAIPARRATSSSPSEALRHD